jgi:hypothetical protein
MSARYAWRVKPGVPVRFRRKEPWPVRIPEPTPSAATPGPASVAAAREMATIIPMRILTRHLTEGYGIQNPRLASVVAQAIRFAGTD